MLSAVKRFETGVDEESGIVLMGENGQMAVIALSMRAKQPKRGVVAGELGYIEVSEYPRADRAAIVYTADGRREEITCSGVRGGRYGKSCVGTSCVREHGPFPGCHVAFKQCTEAVGRTGIEDRTGRTEGCTSAAYLIWMERLSIHCIL